MGIKTKIRESLVRLSGYWIYKLKDIPVGCDLLYELKEKMGLKAQTIFDVGANIGQTAIFYHNSFPEGNVYSFEPVSKTFADLKSRTASIPQIKCFQLALGNEIGSKEIKLFDSDLSNLNSLSESAMNTNSDAFIENISITTGDQFCKENNIQKIDFLKIDTEGFEIPVLMGFSEMLKTSKISAIYCEVGYNPGNKRNTYFENLNAFMYKNNYSFYGMYEICNSHLKWGGNYGNALYLSQEFINKMP